MARTVSSPNRCCTAAENRRTSAPIALSAVMPRHSAARTFSSGAAASVATAASARALSFGMGVASALRCASTLVAIGLRGPGFRRTDALQAGCDRIGSPFRIGAARPLPWHRRRTRPCRAIRRVGQGPARSAPRCWSSPGASPSRRAAPWRRADRDRHRADNAGSASRSRCTARSAATAAAMLAASNPRPRLSRPPEST